MRAKNISALLCQGYLRHRQSPTQSPNPTHIPPRQSPQSAREGLFAKSVAIPPGTKLRPWQNRCQVRLPPAQAHD